MLLLPTTLSEPKQGDVFGSRTPPTRQLAGVDSTAGEKPSLGPNVTERLAGIVSDLVCDTPLLVMIVAVAATSAPAAWTVKMVVLPAKLLFTVG